MEKYIIGIDTASSKSKGAMVVAKHTNKGIEIVGVSHYSKHPRINRIKFKWRAWMLYLKYFRKVVCVEEKG